MRHTLLFRRLAKLQCVPHRVVSDQLTVRVGSYHALRLLHSLTLVQDSGFGSLEALTVRASRDGRSQGICAAI